MVLQVVINETMINRMEYELMSIVTYQNGIEIKHDNIKQLHLIHVEPIIVVGVFIEIHEYLNSLVLLIYLVLYEYKSILVVIECNSFRYRN